jgi:hypothetical protein
LDGRVGGVYHLHMTEADRKQTIRDHITRCRKERETALEQMKLLTVGGAKVLV